MATLATQLTLVLVAVFLLAAGLTLVDRWVDGRPLRRRRRRFGRAHRRVRPVPEPQRRPVQVVAADLRRLSRQLSLVPAGASLVRWRALWAAYDEVLVEAAALLEMPHELTGAPIGTARDLERLRLTAALEAAGLVVRD